MDTKFSANTMASMGLSRLNGAQPTGTQTAQQQAQVSASVQSAPVKFSAALSGGISEEFASRVSIPVALVIAGSVYLYLRFGGA